MLACAVGIPVLAMSGASWSEIAKKFQNLRWPAIVEFASASPPAAPPVVETPPSLPSPAAQPLPFHSDAAPLANSFPQNDPPPLPTRHEDAAGAAKIPSNADDIPERLKQLGATYYVLESWGDDQQLYRFFCKMAVADSADYTRCFEATGADPRQAMQQVLQQVESWRGATANVGS
jgi:hypothetical protein